MMKSDRRTLLRDGALLFGLTGIAGGPRAARASAGDEDTSSAGHEGRTLGTISGVVDFRVRPPFKSFADSFLFRPRDASSRGSGISRGRPTYRSFQERSMEAFVDEMDAAGIERAVVMARGPQREMAGRPGAQRNEDVAELLELYPERFVGFGGIDGRDVHRAVEQIERAVSWGFTGIAMDNGWSDPPMYDDDEKLFPIYEKCADEGLIVSLTNSIAVGPDITYCNPVQVQRVAKRFRDLTILVPHNCWPWITEMLGVAMSSNIYLMVDYYVYVPHMMGAQELVTAAKSFLGDRLLFASGYPVRGLEESVEMATRLPFEDSDLLERCMGRNATRLLAG